MLPNQLGIVEWRSSIYLPMPEESRLEIRRPLGIEWAACRMLLPEAFSQGTAPEALIALDCETAHISGAAAFRYSQREMLDLRIHVVPEYRRKGIGTQLLRRTYSLAAERGLGEICGCSNVAVEPEAEGFLLANDFRRSARLYGVVGDLLPLWDRLRATFNHLVKTGRIPSAAKLTGLDEGPHDQLAKMYCAYIATARSFHPGYILPHLRDKRMAGSSVLMVDGIVRGMLLAELNDGHNVATVHARVVSPGYRGGWANCLLMLRSLEQAFHTGSRRVRFEVPDGNSDTRKLMLRCNAETTRTLCWFVRDLRHPQGCSEGHANVV